MNAFEVVERDGVRYAEIIRAEATVRTTSFFSPPDSSLQFGLLAHEAGFAEAPHTHKHLVRTIDDLQQMFVVQRGVVEVEFFAETKAPFHRTLLRAGDAILLVHGAHAIRAIEDMQCITVKQGPFAGPENDKVEL